MLSDHWVLDSCHWSDFSLRNTAYSVDAAFNIFYAPTTAFLSKGYSVAPKVALMTQQEAISSGSAMISQNPYYES